MNWQYSPYAMALFGTAAITALVGVVAWRRRSVRGGAALAAMLFAVAEWSLAAGLEEAAVPSALKIILSKIEYLGYVCIPPFFLLFSLHYAGQRKWLARKWVSVLWIVPVVTLTLALTNDWHGVLWSSFAPTTVNGIQRLIYGHGPWFWVVVAHVYALVMTGAVVIARATLRLGRVYRRQTVTLLVAVLFPCLTGVMYVAGLSPWPGLDTAPLGFAITALLLAWGMLGFGILDLVPVARDALVEHMSDGVVVLDGQNRIVDVNPAAQGMLAVPATALIGSSVAEALANWQELAGLLGGVTKAQEELAREIDSGARQYDVRISNLFGVRRQFSGRLVLIRDITARRQVERERDQLIVQLQEALVSVKTLRGLVPICASCKRIRDDQGYWHAVELYVAQHSEAEFTHGICPECRKRLYPEYETQPAVKPGA